MSREARRGSLGEGGGVTEKDVTEGDVEVGWWRWK